MSKSGPINGPAEGVRYRFVGRAASHFAARPQHHLHGSQHVHRAQDGGQSWQVISPDLTLNDRTRMGSSGGLTGDNIGVEYAGVVFGIAESPIEKGMIWVGTNDGQVQLTRDNGTTWSNLTGHPAPGLGLGAEHRAVALRRRHRISDRGCWENNRDPWVYKTTDYGKTWRLIVNGIPKAC